MSSQKNSNHEEFRSHLREEYSREKVIEFACIMNLMPYLSAHYDLSSFSRESFSRQYHYTDANGLIGIISSGRFWATELGFLNDPAEGVLLAEVILGFMENKAGGINDIETEVISSIRKSIKNPKTKCSTFSVSFCEDGDLLSQWRGYGSFGKGYSIGVNFKEGIHPQHARLSKVRYGSDELKEIAIDLLDIFSNAKYRNELSDIWAYVLTSLSATHKDSGYSEERESRIIYNIGENGKTYFPEAAPLKFRTRNGILIPYVDLNPYPSELGGNDMLPIEQIVVGPGLDFEQSKISLEMLLKERGYDGVEIIPSKIAFRP